MFKVNTAGRYLVHDKKDKMLVSDNTFYNASEINGFYSKSHRVQVTNTETGEKKMLFPGEKIKVVKRKSNAKSK